MLLSIQSNIQNRLLRVLAPDDFGRVREALEPVALNLGDVIQRAEHGVEHVTFPERGLGSVLSVTSEGRRLEVGVYGRDGMSGCSLLLGSDLSPHEHVVQVAGSGWRMPAGEFVRQTNESASLRTLLLKYVHTFMTQAAQTALSNGVYRIEARLARWLLMCHDRVDGDELPLTHEFLAIMLAVRRPSVTVALHLLQGRGFIRSRRAHVTVRDRQGLREMAGESYGAAEAEYARLVGAPM